MVKKRARKTAPRRRYTTSPRRRSYRRSNKNGYKSIGPAGLTLGIAAAYIPKVQLMKTHVEAWKVSYKDYVMNGLFLKPDGGARKDFVTWVSKAQLKKAAAYGLAGYVAGEAVAKYAPTAVKKPVGKIAKKVPKLIK